MRKKIWLFVVLLLICLATTAHAEGLTARGTVLVNGQNADRVHFREEPSSSAQSLGLLFTGTALWYYTDLNSEWVMVGLPGAQGPDCSVVGYIKSEYLYSGNPIHLPTRFRQAHIVGISANSWVNLREDIGYRVGTIKQLKLGEQVTVLGELSVDGGWSLVQVDGFTGYVVTSYLQYDETAYINGLDADRVHLRQSASQSSQSLGLYFTGTQVICLSDMNATWVKVKIGELTGYMMSKYLTKNPVTPQQPMAVIADVFCNYEIAVYKTMQERSELAGYVPYGELITVLGEYDGWYYVRYGSIQGYAKKTFLRIEKVHYGGAMIDGKTSDRVHLREGPSANAKSLGLYFTGTPVSYLSNPKDTWVQVQIGAITGYMMSQYLTTVEVAPKQPTGTVYNVKDEIEVTRVPHERGEFAVFVPYGDRVTILGETSDGWYYVRYNGLLYGYVRTYYIKLD